jgi:hypothetical protein
VEVRVIVYLGTNKKNQTLLPVSPQFKSTHLLQPYKMISVQRSEAVDVISPCSVETDVTYASVHDVSSRIVAGAAEDLERLWGRQGVDVQHCFVRKVAFLKPLRAVWQE